MVSSESRYRIIRAHAAGNLGQVSVAEDAELHREVALKEIRAEYADDTANRARFVLEAEITGRLEHPGIVPVYGLGQHADGRPYYAMRLVRGATLEAAINDFHGASHGAASFDSVAFRNLLGRFIEVCNAVEYAHSRGVLHRDLKPSNIMLGKYGETLVVDWGLAKARGREEHYRLAEERTLVPNSNGHASGTRAGRAIGTPAFMSPEQASGRLDAVGPASDIYSLGATLFFLLAGQTSFTEQDFTSYQELFEKIQRGRFRPPRAINPKVPQPLQAICLKAMATAPQDRYAAARLLADDLERYLANEPVGVYVESLVARTRRWLRRHPAFVAGLAATLVMGLVSVSALTAVVTRNNRLLTAANAQLLAAHHAERDARQDAENRRLQAANARDQEAVARQHAQQAEAAARASERAAATAKEFAEQQQRRAETEKHIAQAVKNFLQNDLLQQADPWNQADAARVAPSGAADVRSDPTIRQLLDRSALTLAPDRIETRFPQMPLVQAEILRTVGVTYRDIGQFRSAITHLERARGLYVRQSGEDSDESLATQHELALAYRLAGKLEDAARLFEHVRDRRMAGQDPHAAATHKALSELAWTRLHSGSVAEAVQLFEQVRAERSTPSTADDAAAQANLHGLAMAYLDAGRHREAIELFKQVRERKIEVLGAGHPSALTTQHGLALAYRSAGRTEEAISLLEQTRDQKTTSLGAYHPSTLATLQALAIGYREAGRLPDAVKLFEQVRHQRTAKQGHEHPDTLAVGNELAMTYLLADKIPDAQRLWAELFPTAARVLGRDHPWTLKIARNWCQALEASGEFQQADGLRRELGINP